MFATMNDRTMGLYVGDVHDCTLGTYMNDRSFIYVPNERFHE